MKLVVIESPYASATDEGVARNLAYLDACMADCFARNESPFASHGLYTRKGVLDDRDPAQRRKGIEAGLDWASLADVTVVYQDLGISDGMKQGIKHAESMGRPVVYRFLPGWEAAK